MPLSDKDTTTIVNGLRIAVGAIQVLTPIVEDLLRKGEVSVEDQAALEKIVADVRNLDAFKGSHWQKGSS
jgi:hypothetical protein